MKFGVGTAMIMKCAAYVAQQMGGQVLSKIQISSTDYIASHYDNFLMN
jgi:hypothetical protein